MQGNLKASPRENHGKDKLKASRAQGEIPAILYGKGIDNVSFYVKDVQFWKNVKASGRVMEIEYSGKKYLANVEEVQKDPVSHRLTHISFHNLNRNEKTVVSVPVHLEGAPVGAKEGGVLIHGVSEVNLKGLPGDMPEALHVNVAELEFNHSLHISDIKLPPGLEFDNHAPEQVVATCAPPKVEAVEPDTTEVEPEVVGEIKPTEGEAPAAEGKDGAEKKAA